MSLPRVAIYSITYNRMDYTKRLLNELKKSITIPYDHFIIDNCSTDGNADFLMSKSNEIKKVVLNKENKGVAIAQNQALDIIGNSYDYIIKVDPDMEFVTKDWISELITISKKMDDNFLLSPFVDFCEDIDINELNKKLGIERFEYREIAGHKVGLTKHVGGMARFAHRKIYQGYRWDENLPLFNLEDNLFSEYCIKKGILLGYVEDVIVKHDAQQHMRDYNKYYKAKHSKKYIIPNKKYSMFNKLIINLKAINYYYSDYGMGEKTFIGKILIPLKKSIKKIFKLP